MLNIDKVEKEIEFLNEIRSNKNRKIFGTSSEEVDVNQISIFNEPKKYSDSKIEEHTLEEIKYKRDKKNNLLGAIKNINGKKGGIYSLFTTSIKWFYLEINRYKFNLK